MRTAADKIFADAIEAVNIDHVIKQRLNDLDASIALGVLWDARKYLNLYPGNEGLVAYAGLYTDQHFGVKSDHPDTDEHRAGCVDCQCGYGNYGCVCNDDDVE